MNNSVKMILEKKEKGRITMLGTLSCPLQSGAEVEEQERDMEERSRDRAMSRNPGRGISGRRGLCSDALLLP